MRKNKRMINVILVKQNEEGYIDCEPMTILDDLDTFYKLMDCSTIDIVTRYIDNKPYDIIIDDEGLLKDPRKISMFESRYRETLVGNLIVCPLNTNEGEEGELGSFENLEIATKLANKIKNHPVYEFNKR